MHLILLLSASPVGQAEHIKALEQKLKQNGNISPVECPSNIELQENGAEESTSKLQEIQRKYEMETQHRQRIEAELQTLQAKISPLSQVRL